MSTDRKNYSLTEPNAVYANRALRRLGLAVGAAVADQIIHLLGMDSLFLDIVLILVALTELARAGFLAERATQAGIRDGRALILSIHEGAFVSIPEGAVR